MCGIVGIVNLRERERIPVELIRGMADTMIHRGPDSSGTFVDDRIALGHRRLEIIDLTDTGRQPMFDLTGRVGIVYNGEVYNYLELRRELEAKGHRFRSNSDTEVMLNAYLEWGIGCLDRFNGMFAFALYDTKNGCVYVARDRIGIKPLYFSLYDDRLIFASEIKGILKYQGFRTSENINALSSYLSYRYPIGEQTLFSNIKSLTPGCYLRIRGHDVTKVQYWELPVIAEREDRGEEFYQRGVRDLLAGSVRYQMRSDVPIGAYLSGGLDSSVTVALMSGFTREPVKTFTIGFDEPGYNEFAYAKQVSDRYRTDHHEITLSSSDYIDSMVKLIRYKDAPLGVPNEPALYVMSRELKKYITVVLSGEGADEIFGGYGRIFRSPYDYQRMKSPAGPSHIVNAGSDTLLRGNLEKLYGGRSFASEQEHFMFLYNYTSWEDKKHLLHHDVVAALDHDKYLDDIWATEFAKVGSLDMYDKYMWMFEKMHIVGLLHRVDMTTMATSVEARVPYIDHRLVEFAFTIPAHYKLKWKSAEDEAAAAVCNSEQISERYDIPKYILKKTFDGDLPEEVVWRKKMGFPVPVHKWLGSDFNTFAKEILLDDRAARRRLYNSENVEAALNDRTLFAEHKFGLKIWMLVNMELWHRAYMDHAN